MFKQKLMTIFKNMFGGDYTKENGKVFWSREGFKELVTTGFLKHFIAAKKSPVDTSTSTVVSKTVSTVVSTQVDTVKKPSKPKKAKKNESSVSTDPKESERS
jgi:hypothetical protein